MTDPALTHRGLARTSFPFSDRLYRSTWSLVWLLLAAWTPPPFHRWRCLLLKAFGAEIALDCRVYGSARIWSPKNLRMDRNAVLGRHAQCYCMAPIHIGENAIISQFAQLVTGTHDIDQPGFRLIARPITIGADAWIAAKAFVGPGVTVGDGAVLGACAVTFKDLPARSVYVGNPARFIRHRANFTTPSPRAAL
ncbi:acetyltransferase [Devosia epidermidihirudinis]|uniref:Acetyltransferase n=1 Tax=Devosia epidermidihirudinis TaxID=1293439 RepID=A0A0F5QD68_9HYPH|nr:acetyltransferase [Devosia epidermidihirudinis]KKC38910.1 acetyltransferase [Devosia epidermidihirudinis]